MLTLFVPGMTKPWAPVDYPVAVKVMKTALEQGANLWNGVSYSLQGSDIYLSGASPLARRDIQAETLIQK